MLKINNRIFIVLIISLLCFQNISAEQTISSQSNYMKFGLFYNRAAVNNYVSSSSFTDVKDFPHGATTSSG
jgi:hypothetical protein